MWRRTRKYKNGSEAMDGRDGFNQVTAAGHGKNAVSDASKTNIYTGSGTYDSYMNSGNIFNSYF